MKRVPVVTLEVKKSNVYEDLEGVMDWIEFQKKEWETEWETEWEGSKTKTRLRSCNEVNDALALILVLFCDPGGRKI